MIIDLSADIAVAVQGLSLFVRWREAISVVVVHLRLAFLDELIQFILDESGEVQVVVLNLLLWPSRIEMFLRVATPPSTQLV